MVSWGWLFDVGGGGNRTGGIGGLVQCAGATGAVRSTFVGLGGLGLARGCSAVADAPEAWLRPCEEAKRDRGQPAHYTLQLVTTWIPDLQPATEPFSHLRQTQGGP